VSDVQINAESIDTVRVFDIVRFGISVVNLAERPGGRAVWEASAVHAAVDANVRVKSQGLNWAKAVDAVIREMRKLAAR
jgi:hypothetical protein